MRQARTSINTLDNVQTISDCQPGKPNNQSAHSRSRSLFGCTVERAFSRGCEAKAQQQFPDFMSHDFASMQCDTLTGSISSSSGSMTDVAAQTVTGSESYDPAPRPQTETPTAGPVRSAVIFRRTKNREHNLPAATSKKQMGGRHFGNVEGGEEGSFCGGTVVFGVERNVNTQPLGSWTPLLRNGDIFDFFFS